MAERFQTLTEKEKQTLRLLVVGYDAKSMARHLGLSIHTINERLRDSRRKLSVSSSREAARLLLDVEGEAPKNLGDKCLGDAAAECAAHELSSQSVRTATRRRIWAIGVMAMLSFAVAAFALSSGPATVPVAAPLTASASVATAQSEASKAALNFLELIDAARWDDSYRSTGAEFRRLNTVATWGHVSQTVRAPLGAVVSRELVSDDTVPSTQGYRLIKFRTHFANKPGTVETVTMAREGSNWKITGITID